jgi:hypothetical protein
MHRIDDAYLAPSCAPATPMNVLRNCSTQRKHLPQTTWQRCLQPNIRASIAGGNCSVL